MRSFLLAALFLPGCAYNISHGTDADLVMLKAGQPLGYQVGFDHGCATAGGTPTRDEDRAAEDGNYRNGWRDGKVACTRRAEAGL